MTEKSFPALRACIRFSPTLVQDQARAELPRRISIVRVMMWHGSDSRTLLRPALERR